MTIAHDTSDERSREEQTAEVYYDPYDVDIVGDPYPTYARLREEAPLYYNERYDFWALSRHADVEKALSNWEIVLEQPKRHSRADRSRTSTCPRA